MREILWDSIDAITDFAFFYDFYGALDSLQALAAEENWSYSVPSTRRNQKNPILENYIHHTFKRLKAEYIQAVDEDRPKKIYIDDSIACFNTGLFTKNFNPIYAVFFPAKRETDRKPFSFSSFEQHSSNRLGGIRELPRRANYFSNISELIYDPTLDIRANIEHIMQENIGRFPESIRDDPMLISRFTGAIELAQKRVQANYRAAVPTYYRNEICLMLPLYLTSLSKTDLALAIKRNEGFYTAKTILTLDMAYNDARLIAKPDSDWLIP